MPILAGLPLRKRYRR